MKKKPIYLKQQSGAVLFICLILMLLLTMIGVTGTQVTSLEEKMAGNMRDKNLAFQAAESALRAGEQSARDTEAAAVKIICPDTLNTNPAGFFLARDANCDGTAENTIVWDNIDWDTQSVLYVGNALSGLSANPRHIVEDMGVVCTSITVPCPGADLKRNYRITARATGGTTDALVILQTTIQL
jgi:type IV pilus assembly protein PilX